MAPFSGLKDAVDEYVKISASAEKDSELHEAILDGMKITELGDLSFLSGMSKLGYLSVNSVNLKKLQHFPKCSIQRLELADNHISGGLECLANLTDLEELLLGGNPLSSLDQLKPLSSLTSLRILDVTNCPVSEKSIELSKFVFDLLPNLEALNGKDRDGASVDFEDNSSFLDTDEDDDEDDDDDESDDGSDQSEEEEEDGESDEESDSGNEKKKRRNE
jgi:hypothetical protein